MSRITFFTCEESDTSNQVPRIMFFDVWAVTRWFSLRLSLFNSLASVEVIVRFPILDQLVRKYRTHTLSMKYSICHVLLWRISVNNKPEWKLQDKPKYRCYIIIYITSVNFTIFGEIRGTQRFVSGNICSEGLKSSEIFGFNWSES